MTEQLITEIQRKMLPYLNNEQLMHLRDAMAETLEGATITYDSGSIPADEADAVEAFITAKRIEGCSEKTLSYYRKTIEALIAGVGKAVRQITTDDLRRYLTNYQVQRRSSKVTIDNIRRILSSFFSWLEDEDFIVKSPVRRIHKVKTAKVVKDTYTDEVLELMRDNCTTARDLAMIDLLASSGMRVGELVTLNREDINFNECALPGFVDSKNEEKTERNAGYLVVSHSGGGMLRQGTRKGIRRTPANRGMRAHWVVKGLDISEDVCHGMCP